MGPKFNFEKGGITPSELSKGVKSWTNPDEEELERQRKAKEEALKQIKDSESLSKTATGFFNRMSGK